MNISLQMYTMREYTKTMPELDTTLSKIAGIGYKYIQPSIPDGVSPEEFRKLLDSHGLKADSFLGNFDMVEKKAEQMAKTAAILETPIVRFGGMPYDYCLSKEKMKRYAEIINNKGKALNKYGMKFIYHFHAYEYTNFDDCTGMDILVGETNPDFVVFQPDVHWMAAAGVEPSAGLTQFKGRAEYIHMQGYAIIPDEEKKEYVSRVVCPVGQGNLNWRGIVKAAKEIGINMYVVEMDDCLNDPFDDIKTSYVNLSNMLDKEYAL